MPVLTVRCGAGLKDPRKKETKKKVEETEEEEEEDEEEDDDETGDDEGDGDDEDCEDDEENETEDEGADEDTDEDEEEKEEEEENEGESEDEYADENEEDENEDNEEDEQDLKPCTLFDIHFPYTDDPVNDGEDYIPEVAEHDCWESGHVHALINPGIDICNILEFPAPMARYYWFKARASEHSGAKVTREIRDGASHKILKWQVADEELANLSHKLASEQNWEIGEKG
ncbi:hypothetical protein BGZ92_005571 [Podila epicladia]|nr:hypothetical protein BGZ92_005571 [Podila epicladia]